MNLTLRARLARIEKAVGTDISSMTEQQVEARLAELMPRVRAEAAALGGNCDGLTDEQVVDLVQQLDPDWIKGGAH